MVLGLPNIVFLVIICIWLVVLTFLTVRLLSHYNRLTKGVTDKGLLEILNKLLGEQEVAKQDLIRIEAKLTAVINQGQTHLQKVGIVRFNPFADTGGSQSFTVAFLDADDNGILMTNLYARSGNRWYIKEVRKGMGRDLQLAKEEESAIKRARLSGRDLKL